MTRFSKWSVRISLLYLIMGFTIGSVMLADKGIGIYPDIMFFLPVHIEFLLMGWMVNLIFGVAYWMFPRFNPSRSQMDYPRGFNRAAWAGLILLNTGIILYVVSRLFLGFSTLSITGKILQYGGIFGFALNIWPRVKPISDYS